MLSDSARLAEAGFHPTADGEVVMSGPAASLFQAWLRYLRHLLEPFYNVTIEAPLFLSGQVLEDAGYPQHFPQHLFRSGNPMGPAEKYLSPAACFHVYPSLAGCDLTGEPYSALILGRCARYEGGKWRFPFRLAAFHMLELVTVGEPMTVGQRRSEVAALLVSAFGDLGMKGALEPATDAFFLGNDEGARIVQKLKGLKREYVVPGQVERVVVASLNDHEDYFGRCFGLTLGRPENHAYSFCAAFGLERLTGCGLLAWGGEVGGWPRELQI